MGEDEGGVLPTWLTDLSDEISRQGGVAASGLVALAVLLSDPRAFFREFLIPWISETVVGWILSGILGVYFELVRVTRVLGWSINEGIVTPFREIAGAIEEITESWVGWQVGLLEGLAVDAGLVSPFVTLIAISIVLIVNVWAAWLLWDIANDYLPLQLVSGTVNESIETARAAIADAIERLAPPYGGESDE